jgi:dihydroneopterin aldolase
MSATMTIELKALRFYAYHGWLEEEAIIGNEFEVSVVGSFAAKDNMATINDTVDYVAVYDLVKTIFMQREKLLETVAQKTVAALHARFPQIEELQISITKLKPPIVSFTGTVGITLRKSFK